MKKTLILMLLLVASGAFADGLWKKSVKIFGQYYTEQPKSAYISMASSASGKKGYIIEQWLEFKYKNGKKYQRILKVSKNGVEKKIPKMAREVWKLSKNKKKKSYKGNIEIFHADKQANVKVSPTGRSKVIQGKYCREYRYRLKVLRSKLKRRRRSRRRRRSKYRYNTGLAYVELKTGAPLEIKMFANNTKYMKKSKPSVIRFRFDGEKLYAYYMEMNMNISFFGKSKKLQSIVKMKY